MKMLIISLLMIVTTYAYTYEMEGFKSKVDYVMSSEDGFVWVQLENGIKLSLPDEEGKKQCLAILLSALNNETDVFIVTNEEPSTSRSYKSIGGNWEYIIQLRSGISIPNP